jgi:hypothetical protein
MPDVDPTTDGALTDCDNIIPSTQGLTAGASPVDVGLGSIEPVTGAVVSSLLDGTRRLIAGTQTKLYEATANSWIDRSRVGGYTGLNRWRFATFGNATLATNRVQVLQQSIASGNFADIAGAPAASILVTSSGFVLALNVSGGALGDAPDGWWCSGLYDQSVWTPSVAAQCANGRLVDAPGAITAGQALGDVVVAYKTASMYLGRYVGPPIVWAWQRVPGEIGVSSQECVVSVGTRHFFIGPTDFYEFDGTVPRPMDAPVREWFFANLSQANRHLIFGAADLPRDLVYWYFPSANAVDTPDLCVVYNIRTKRWGKFRRATLAALEYQSALLTFDDLGTKFATYDALPQIAYDSPFWLGGQRAPAVFLRDGANCRLYSLTGAPAASSMTTCDVGDETNYTFLSRVTPRYRVTPAAATATNYHRATLGESHAEDATVMQSRARFDFRRSARWHRVRMNWTGAVAIDGADFAVAVDSEE